MLPVYESMHPPGALGVTTDSGPPSTGGISDQVTVSRVVGVAKIVIFDLFLEWKPDSELP